MSDRITLSRPIFLIGYMGSGKTTLGRAFAKHAGVPFIDLDDYIEERRGATVSEIFAASGEEGFREIERETVREVVEKYAALPAVIACGGGTPCYFDNLDIMNLAGVTVYLDASREALIRRLSAARSKRPLIARLSDDELGDFIDDALQKRLPHYSRARLRFPSDRLESAEEIAQSIAALIDLLSNFRKFSTCSI